MSRGLMRPFFDERFAGSARQALMLWPLRVVMALVIAVVLGLAASPTVALCWASAVLAIEPAYCRAAIGVTRRRSRFGDYRLALVHALAVVAWSLAGVLLWRTGAP